MRFARAVEAGIQRISPSRRLGAWHLGVILALASALAFATMGPIAKLAYERGASVTGLLAARYLVGSVVWLAVLGPHLRAIRWRSRATAWAIAGGGVGGVAGLAEFGAYRLLPVALVLVFLFISPVWLIGLEWVLYGRRVGLWHLLAVAFLLAGLVLLLGVSIRQLSAVAGVGLALLASVAATLLFLGIQESVRQHGPNVTSGLVVWSQAVVAFVVALGQGSLGSVVEDARVAVLALVLGVLSSVIGVRLLAGSVGRIGAFNSAVVSATEVVMGATIAWIVLAEALNPPQILGGVLIMLGTVIIDQKRTVASER